MSKRYERYVVSVPRRGFIILLRWGGPTITTHDLLYRFQSPGGDSSFFYLVLLHEVGHHVLARYSFQSPGGDSSFFYFQNALLTTIPK